MIEEIDSLTFDSTGRAYPPNPEDHASWDKMYLYKGDVYMVVGSRNRKEWDKLSDVIRRGLATYD